MITYSEFKASIAYLLEQDLEGWFPNGHATWTWYRGGDDILVRVFPFFLSLSLS